LGFLANDGPEREGRSRQPPTQAMARHLGCPMAAYRPIPAGRNLPAIRQLFAPISDIDALATKNPASETFAQIANLHAADEMPDLPLRSLQAGLAGRAQWQAIAKQPSAL
jgi:hypothetical protein